MKVSNFQYMVSPSYSRMQPLLCSYIGVAWCGDACSSRQCSISFRRFLRYIMPSVPDLRFVFVGLCNFLTNPWVCRGAKA